MLNLIVFVFLFVWWIIRWSMATVFVLAVMAGAGYYVYDQALRGGDHVEVPDVVLRPITDASYRLAERGLEVGERKQVADERVPKSYVIAQRPLPGKVVRTGRKVNLTVSAGTESLAPPNLLGKILRDVEQSLKRTSFSLGVVSRVAHAAPRDTVLAQDPAPNRLMPNDAAIHLLVSDGGGQGAGPFIMPDLMDKPVEEVLRILAPYGVRPYPNPVEQTDAPFDIVLEQQPPAGSLIREGDAVFYTVRTSGAYALPDAKRTVQVQYTVPISWFEREVRIDTIDRNGIREVAFPREEHYVNGQPPKYGAGYVIVFSATFTASMTVEIYLDGQLAQTYYYEGEADPVITQYNIR